MKEKLKKKSVLHKFWWLIALFVMICAAMGWWGYKSFVLDGFTDKPLWVYVTPQTTYEQLLDTLEQKLGTESLQKFKKLADMDGYEKKMRPGAFLLEPEMSAVDVYRKMLYGLQNPVKFTFNNIRTLDQFAARAAQQLLMDSAQVMALVNDPAFLKELGYTPQSLPAMFLPDTYQFYWTLDPRELFKRLKKESDRFWNEERCAKAKAMGLTPLQLSTVASIAEEETNSRQERGVVGRLYINRLQRGMLLQADPTVKFAVGDFSLKRVLSVHLQNSSPYNTYKYAGVPPGPIRIPDKATIDSILASKPHDYLYMCAKEDFSGLHNFAKTLREHNNNAARYHQALNKAKIR